MDDSLSERKGKHKNVCLWLVARANLYPKGLLSSKGEAWQDRSVKLLSIWPNYSHLFLSCTSLLVIIKRKIYYIDRLS